MKIDLINEKVYNEKNEKLVRKLIIDCFKEKDQWYRKLLINACIERLELSEEIINDKSYNSIFTKCKSLIGSVITSMINEGYLFLNESKLLVLLKDIAIIIHEDEVKNYIGSLLKTSSFSNSEIINNCIKYFKVDKTETKEDDKELKNIIKQILKQSINDKVLKFTNNKYSFVSSNTALDCKIYNVINESKKEPIINCLKKAISIKGGEFFEAYSVKILSEYFLYKNNTIINAKVVGGSEDNGIDGIIELNDDINKKTNVLIQAKVRTKCQVTLKEVREFYGAFKAKRGDIGIFITNSTFHKEAIKFSKDINDLILINDEMLLKIASITNTGIVKNNDYYILDEDVFVKENFNKNKRSTK